MKIGSFAALAITGMTATSAAVWTLAAPATPATAAAPAPASAPAFASAPPAALAAPAPLEPERTTFQAGGTLAMEGRLGHAVLPAGGGSETFLFVDVAPEGAVRATVRAPLDLAIVIDRSGSMRGKRLRNALAAARTAIDRLDDGDVVSVITYDTRTEVAVPATALTPATRPRVLAALGAIRARGDTCISCGIQTGMQSLGRAPGRVSRILVLSDGEATAGVRTADGFRRIAEQCRSMGASITSIGVDVDYNERIMAALARGSNGRHFFVESATALPAIFDQEMDRLLRTVATDAEVAVDLAPGVVVQEVYDRAFRLDGASRLVVPLGAFADSDRKTVLVRLHVPGGAAGQRAVADVRLAYRDLVSRRPTRSEGQLAVRLSGDAGELAPLDALVSARLGQSEAAAALEQANALAEDGDTAGARALLDTRRREIQERSTRARRSVARGRAADLEKGFSRLDGILGGAARGFAEPPPVAGVSGAGGGFAPKPQAARKRKAQVRANQAEAVELGF